MIQYISLTNSDPLKHRKNPHSLTFQSHPVTSYRRAITAYFNKTKNRVNIPGIALRTQQSNAFGLALRALRTQESLDQKTVEQLLRNRALVEGVNFNHSNQAAVALLDKGIKAHAKRIVEQNSR